MWEIVLSVFGAAVIAVVGWLFKRAIDRWDKFSEKLGEHEAKLVQHETECHTRWTETVKTLGVHGVKLANLEEGQARMDKKLDRILEARPAQS